MFKRVLLLALSFAAVVVFAASTYTPHFNLELPADGDSAWGDAIRTNFTDIDEQMYINEQATQDHIDDAAGAHAATAISSTGGGTLCTSADDVQEYLDCLEGQVGPIIGGTVVTTDTTQTITGLKTFTQTPIFSDLSTGVIHSDLSGILSSSLIVDDDISGGAGILLSKLEATTASRALVSDGSGVITPATTTATEIGYVNGVTSSIQTQLDGKQAGPLTGDVTTSGAAATLATVNGNVGSFGSSTSIPSFTVNAKGLLTAASGNAVVAPAGTLTGATLAAGVTASSLTSVGTIGTGTWQGSVVGLTYGGSAKALTAVAGGVVWTDADSMEVSAAGNAGEFLTSNGTSAPSWSAGLSNPMNTAGQIIYGGASGVPTALSQGTKGQPLVAQVGTNTPGYQWGSTNSVSSADYTITTTDGYSTIAMSTGNTNRALNLPDLASSTDRKIRVVKTDSGTGVITVTRAGADTFIGGATTDVIYMQGDSKTYEAGASNWIIAVVSQHQSGSYTSTITNSTNVASSSFVAASYVREGNWVTVTFNVTVTPTGAATTTQIFMSLPIAPLSNLADNQLLGSFGAVSASGAAGAFGGIISQASFADQLAHLSGYPISTAGRAWTGSFRYYIK